MHALVRIVSARLLVGMDMAILSLLLGARPARALEVAALTESLPPLNCEQGSKVVGFSSELLDLIRGPMTWWVARAIR